MKNRLEFYTNGTDNNFNLIRFVAATLVIFSHSYPLLKFHGTDPLEASTRISFGGLAVDIFFITSGFLICRSFLNKPSIIDYALSRILRIYPALIIAVTFCVLMVGPIFTTSSLAGYFSDSSTWVYWIRNSILIFNVQHELPEVFTTLPHANAVNGSLWTLPYELYMYTGLVITMLLVNLASRLTDTHQQWFMICIAVISTLLHLINSEVQVYEGQLLRLHSMFFTGAAFYVARTIVPMNGIIALTLASALLISTINIHVFHILYSASLAYIILYLAYIPGGIIRKFNQTGDYSYGIYIYAFPIQQMLVSVSITESAYMLTILAFVPTIIMAWLSWNLVEKPTLKLKKVLLNSSWKKLRILSMIRNISPL